jgi:choline dehydrogenase-like flavoprotein
MRTSFDLVIVGSGPSAATTARRVAELRPATSILMIELGAAITDPPGQHVFQRPAEERAAMWRSSQGPQGDVETTIEAFIRADPLVPHPGLELIDPGSGMPLASMATNVGGMGSFWSCGTPRPMGSERIPFIDGTVWDQAVLEAEAVLRVGRSNGRETRLGARIHEVLDAEFGSLLAPGSVIEPIGAAGYELTETGPKVGLGPRDILAPLDVARPSQDLEIRADTLCEAVLTRGDRASGVRLRDRGSGERYEVRARTVVVAGGSFRTPQLLWASGLRLDAVGRHLMDHPRTLAAIEIDPNRLGVAVGPGDGQGAFTAVPFSDSGMPYLGLVEHSWDPGSSWSGMTRTGGYGARAGFLTMDWTGRTWPDPANRVVFSDTGLDRWGMPAMSIEYRLSEIEQAEFEAGAGHIDRVRRALGDYCPGGEPRRLPLGSHLHYMGTVRMGAADDGTSVCDTSSRVWGFRNLFVGGNGVIPTPTACNPTLTNVALAVLAAPAIAASLD